MKNSLHSYLPKPHVHAGILRYSAGKKDYHLKEKLYKELHRDSICLQIYMMVCYLDN